MSKTQHPTITHNADKVRETVDYCKRTGAFGISGNSGLYDLARERFGLDVKNDSIASQLSRGDTIPLP